MHQELGLQVCWHGMTSTSIDHDSASSARLKNPVQPARDSTGDVQGIPAFAEHDAKHDSCQLLQQATMRPQEHWQGQQIKKLWHRKAKFPMQLLVSIGRRGMLCLS